MKWQNLEDYLPLKDKDLFTTFGVLRTSKVNVDFTKGLSLKVRRQKAKPPIQQRKITDVLKRIAQKKRIKLFLGAIVLLLIVAYFVVGKRGTYKLISFYNQKEKLIEEIKQLEIKNKELEEFKLKLENDPQSIEKVAREKYKMKKKGERVYQIVEK